MRMLQVDEEYSTISQFCESEERRSLFANTNTNIIKSYKAVAEVADAAYIESSMIVSG